MTAILCVIILVLFLLTLAGGGNGDGLADERGPETTRLRHNHEPEPAASNDADSQQRETGARGDELDHDSTSEPTAADDAVITPKHTHEPYVSANSDDDMELTQAVEVDSRAAANPTQTHEQETDREHKLSNRTHATMTTPRKRLRVEAVEENRRNMNAHEVYSMDVEKKKVGSEVAKTTDDELDEMAANELRRQIADLTGVVAQYQTVVDELRNRLSSTSTTAEGRVAERKENDDDDDDYGYLTVGVRVALPTPVKADLHEIAAYYPISEHVLFVLNMPITTQRFSRTVSRPGDLAVFQPKLASDRYGYMALNTVEKSHRLCWGLMMHAAYGFTFDESFTITYTERGRAYGAVVVVGRIDSRTVAFVSVWFEPDTAVSVVRDCCKRLSDRLLKDRDPDSIRVVMGGIFGRSPDDFARLTSFIPLFGLSAQHTSNLATFRQTDQLRPYLFVQTYNVAIRHGRRCRALFTTNSRHSYLTDCAIDCRIKHEVNVHAS